MEILHRNKLPLGGFAGLKEHQLVKDSKVFGGHGNQDGSWQGLGNFVYLADARFQPNGETKMHPHHEIDVISVMVEGQLSHDGSMGKGTLLSKGDVQVQSAGGEGFVHNEINPDDEWNRILQLWVLPEIPGQKAVYKTYHSKSEKLISVYGGDNQDFQAKTHIQLANLKTAQTLEIDKKSLIYVVEGKGSINEEDIQEGDLVKSSNAVFQAENNMNLLLVSMS